MRLKKSSAGKFYRIVLKFDYQFNIIGRKSERGTSTVELALVAPLLLLIILATFSLADAGQKKALLARAVLEGGRLSVVKERPEVESYVKKIMKTADPSVKENNIRVSVVNKNNLPLLNGIVKPIEVTAKYDLPIFYGFTWMPKLTLTHSYTFEKWDNGVIVDVPVK